MGSDGFKNIDKWKNSDQLLKNYPIIIYNRPGFELTELHKRKVSVVDAPLLEISSTHIRKLIKEKKSIRYLVPENVLKEITKEHYYSSSLENPS
jgi:nicotinate-nucleotide adenylyltransferase